MRWVGLVLAALVVPACELEARDSFDLQGIAAPPSRCVTVVHDALDLGGPLLAYVGDGLGRTGGWGLVSVDGELAIVRVPEPEVEGPTAPVLLGLPAEYAEEVELRAGALPGELWVFSHSNGERLRRVLPEHGEVARNDALINFPIENDNACGVEQTRMLLLIEGRPYVLALPSCADDATLVLSLLELDRDSLDFVTSWELVFDPCAYQYDPSACALENAYSLWSVGPGAATVFPDLARVQVGFTQVRAHTGQQVLPGSEFRADVSMLDLRMTDDGPQVRLISFRDVWSKSWPTNLGRVELAQDPFSVQLYVRNDSTTLEAVLLRLDTIADFYVQMTGETSDLPLGGQGRLVQLEDQSGLLGVDDGVLLAVPLVGVDGWGDRGLGWTTQVLFEEEGLVSLEAAGVGQVLLRFAQSSPRLLHVACLN